MSLSTVPRRWIASLLAVVLVCLQLATAAYACPAPQATAHAAAMAAMPDCESMSSMDSEQPQLCKAHCERDKQSVNNVPVVDVAPAPTVDWLFTRAVFQLPAEDAETLPAVLAAHTGPPAGAPPVYLALQVLRR
jgi:hypothetical protein